jgi:S-(hydroxymethyl)glutathione dehydrogenase/alcohol dehydrogenase
LFQKRIVGALFGGGNPFEEIPRMIDMYRAGMLKLDELVTSQYRLGDVRQGYQDLVDGKNIRGVILHGR